MKIRKVIQILFFALILLISLGHTLEESGITIPLVGAASLHAVCPFGGVVSIYEFFVSGNYVKKIHESSFILMFVVFALAIFMGPVFCGWICPFGTFQEWISKIGKKIFKKKFNTFIPYKVDKYLRFIRYIIMAMVIIKTAQTIDLVFSNIDPYYALFNIWSDEVAITAYIALGITVVLSLFVERPFCKYACPYGALLGITNLFRITKIKREPSTCISCSICDKKCPMNIPLSNIDTLYNHQCISCMECTSEVSCPKTDTMVFSALGRKFNGKTVGIITLLFFIVGVGGTTALGLWKTESSKEPAKYTTGDFAGESNPADIRGSYSLQDIENAFDIPVETLVKAFGLADVADPSNFKIKEFEDRFIFDGDFEVGTDSMRLFVSLYKSLPYTPEESTRLLRSSISVLKDIISEDSRDFLNTIVIDNPGVINNDSIEHEEEKESSLTSITGRTTFRELIANGITKEEIEEVLGISPTDENITVRDFATENSLEFGTLKIEFQDLLDK